MAGKTYLMLLSLESFSDDSDYNNVSFSMFVNWLVNSSINWTLVEDYQFCKINGTWSTSTYNCGICGNVMSDANTPTLVCTNNAIQSDSVSTVIICQVHTQNCGDNYLLETDNIQGMPLCLLFISVVMHPCS